MTDINESRKGEAQELLTYAQFLKKLNAIGLKGNVSKVVEEETEQLDELNDTTLQSYQAKRGDTKARVKTAVDAIDHKLSGKPGLSKHEIHNKGLDRARNKLEASRKKQMAMNPPKPRPAPEKQTGFRSGAIDDTYGT